LSSKNQVHTLNKLTHVYNKANAHANN